MPATRLENCRATHAFFLPEVDAASLFVVVLVDCDCESSTINSSLARVFALLLDVEAWQTRAERQYEMPDEEQTRWKAHFRRSSFRTATLIAPFGCEEEAVWLSRAMFLPSTVELATSKQESCDFQ